MPGIQAVFHFQSDPHLERPWLVKEYDKGWKQRMTGVTWKVLVLAVRSGGPKPRVEYPALWIGEVAQSQRGARIVLEARGWLIGERHRARRQWAGRDQ